MQENRDLSIIFMGTPEFAVPCLEAVHGNYGVRAVVTVPDKPRGRGQKMLPSPVKARAEELGIPVLQPESLKDPEFEAALAALRPDIIVVVAFRILPRSIFTLARLAAFNIHGSLLPRYRGAAPINRAIMNGEKVTGLTSFILQDNVDTGSMLLTRRVEITPGMTAGDLHDTLMPLAAGLAVETVGLIASGNYSPLVQDESLACPAPKIFREDCRINWAMAGDRLADMIHGVSPAPGAWTLLDGETFKILRVEQAVRDFAGAAPGSYVIEGADIFVAAGSGTIKLLEVKPQGKKAISAADFTRGYRGAKSGVMG